MGFCSFYNMPTASVGGEEAGFMVLVSARNKSRNVALFLCLSGSLSLSPVSPSGEPYIDNLHNGSPRGKE